MEEIYIKEFREFLKQTKGLGAITIDHYCRRIRDFDINQLSQEYINQYIQSKGNNSQVRGAMLSFFEMNGITKLYDMPPKATGTKKKRMTRPVSVDEFEKVKRFLYKKEFRHGLVFDLIYQGALRRSEVKTIQFNSFNWEKFLKDITKPCQLKVLGKGDKERVVLISSETTERLFNHFANKIPYEKFINSSSLLFKRQGRVLTNQQLWDIIHYGSVDAIGRDIRCHELRHARATALLKMGVSIHDVKNYLGHSSVATTEIYLHSSQDESIDNIQKILNKNQ